MHIIEIIINGFKTYGRSTTIAGFDRGFNAITGLNGSGKSNILDAILFCLGITKDFDLIRIKKIQELIYKNGTAGVTKAEVTIVFDNHDKRTSPSNYRQHDHLTFSRNYQMEKMRYFINGHSVSQKTYKETLRSVNLNVDVAQFLVAQGCITRLIHLRPPQLSLMIQETAGIATYDAKKLEWTNQIKANSVEIENQERILYMDLGPQIEKYESQIQRQLQFEGQVEEAERLNRDLLRYAYFQANQSLVKELVNLNLHTKNHQDDHEELENCNNYIQYAEKQLAELNKTFKVEELNKNVAQIQQVAGTLRDLQQQINQAKKLKLGSENEIAQMQQNIMGHEFKLKNFDRILQEQKIQNSTLQKVLAARQEIYDQQQRQNYLPAENQKEQIMVITQRMITDVELAQRKYRFDLEALGQYQEKVASDLQNVHKQADNQQERVQVFQTDKAKIQASIKEIEKGLSQTLNLNSDIDSLKTAIRQQEVNVDRVKRELAKYKQVFFNKSMISDEYKPKVYGKVFQLIDIKDERFQKCMEILAGRKLENIVVEDHTVGKYLLKNKDFSNQAIYIIPNKDVKFMCPYQEIKNLIDRVPKQDGDFAYHAIDLVKYAQHVEPSIKYIFGPFIVASSSEYAKRLAFDKLNEKRINVVTLDGDIIDPNGSVSGGYTPENQSILKLFKESVSHTKRIDVETDKLAELFTKLEQKQQQKDQQQDIQVNLKRLYSELQYIEEKLAGLQGMSVEALQNKLIEEQKRLLGEQEKYKKFITEADEKLVKYRQDMKEIESGKNAKVHLEEQKQLSIKEIQEIENQIQENNAIKYNAEIEMTQCQKDLVKFQNIIAKEQAAIATRVPQIQAMEDKQNQLNEQKTELEWKNKDLEQQYDVYTESSQQLIKELDRNKNQLPELVAREKESNKLVQQTTALIDELKKKITSLESKGDYLKHEKPLVTKIPTVPEYEWTSTFDVESTNQRVREVEQEKNRLGQDLNLAIQNTIKEIRSDYDKADIQYRKLIANREQILKNLETLEITRRREIESCFNKVKTYFQEIFESLLPGATATLEQWEGRPLDEGITIAVSINRNPKSLIEMSGGQRSLLALAFILAQLKLCPAPFYILDEIDSALDLAHTENIGQMLAKNFRESQFLLISLKEGMYENANVLFKVSFVDGMSRVERMVLREGKYIPNELTDDDVNIKRFQQSDEGQMDVE